MLILKKNLAVFLILVMMISFTPYVHAVSSISIHTEKEFYVYGDILTFTIEVSEITEEFAILHIIDQAGVRSSAIPIPITDLKTVVPSPFPFEATVYPLGMYTLEIEYSGNSDSTEFELIDSEDVVIPFWIKEISKYWYNDQISDHEFAGGIEFLIKEGIIVVPQSQTQENITEVKIPSWVKVSTGWWIDGNISDKEYASALEYLIKVGIIQV